MSDKDAPQPQDAKSAPVTGGPGRVPDRPEVPGALGASLSSSFGSWTDSLFGAAPGTEELATPRTIRRSTTIEFTPPTPPPSEAAPAPRAAPEEPEEAADPDELPPILGFLIEEESGQMIPLCADVNTIGRGSANTIVLDIPNVSRVHCQLEYSVRGFRITDFASTNGTYVNEERVESRDLQTGDRIRLGAMVFRLERA